MHNYIDYSFSKIFLILIYLILFISSCLIYYGNETWDNFYLLPLFVILLFGIFLFFKININKYPYIYKNISSSTYIVLIGLLIVNFQTILNVFLEYGTISFYLNTSKYDNVFDKVFSLSVIAIISFCIGNGLPPFKKSHIINNKKKLIIVHPKIWMYATCILFGLFIINIDVVKFVSGATYFGSGAYDRVENQADTWENLFDAFNTITIALYIIKNKKVECPNFKSFIKKFPIIFICINIIYIILRALSGDRGPVIYTLMLFFFSYIYISKKRIKLLFAIILFSISAILISLANVFRGMDSELSISQKIQLSVYDDNERIIKKSISPYTQELASSINCNFIAVYDIQNHKVDYKNGEYSLNRLLRIIPGINYIAKFFTGEKLGGGSGEYITTSFFGNHYSYGLGSTPLAELFLDFGIIGVIIGFIIIGAVFKNIDFKLMYFNNLDAISLIFILKMTSLAIYLSRSSLLFILSKSIYVLIIFLVFNYILNKISTYKKY